MDGYAVRAEDAVQGARLVMGGEQAAGLDVGLSVGQGRAIRIFTGAPIPRHADAVVMPMFAARGGCAAGQGGALAA